MAPAYSVLCWIGLAGLISIALLYLAWRLGVAKYEPVDADGDARAGFAAAKRGEFDTAIQLYTAAIDANTLSPEALAITLDNRGIAYHRTGQDERAITDYDQSIRLNPVNAKAFDNLGNAHLSQGQYDVAIEDYDQAIRLNPNSAGALDNRGSAYLAKGQYDFALENYDQSIRLNPNSADAFANRGSTYFLLGDFAKAEADLRTASDLDPKRSYASLWLYLALSRQKKDGRAELFERSPKLDFTSWPGPVVQFYLGHRSAGEVLEAAGATSDEKTRRGRLCEADFYLGEEALLAGHKTEARLMFLAAVSVCATDFVELHAAEADMDRLGPRE